MLCVIEVSDDLILDVYFHQFAHFLLSDKDAPAFMNLCAIGQWKIDESHELEASLCQKFGVRKQKDWPLATISANGEGMKLKSGHWLLVHPVHLVLQRDFFTLGKSLALPPTETETLIADLNRHFSQDGLSFIPSQSGDFWYLHVDEDLDLVTYSLAEAIGRDVGKLIPRGKDGMRLQSLLNEVQMLLHEHPLNQLREHQGLLPVNSIWLSGGGDFKSMNQCAQKPAFRFFANDTLSAGLAFWAGMPYQNSVKNFVTFDAAESVADSVIVVREGGELESAWFAPFLGALKQRKLKLLRCHFDVHGMTFTLTLRPNDTWKFWRKPRPVGHYFNLVS